MNKTITLSIILLSHTVIFAPPKKQPPKDSSDCFAGLRGAFTKSTAPTSRRPAPTTPATTPTPLVRPDDETTRALTQWRNDLDLITVTNPTTGIEIKMIYDGVTALIDKVLRGECFSEKELVGCVGLSCNLTIPFLETIIGDAYWGIGATEMNKPMVLIAFLAVYNALSLTVKKANLVPESALAETAAIQLRMINQTIEDYKKTLREKNPAEAERIIKIASFGTK